MTNTAVSEDPQIKLDTGDLSRLKAELVGRDDESFQEGKVWQAILNVGYRKWRWMSEDQDWSYGDMVEWVGLEYGAFAKVCILLGKYNQQVLGNGHMGYWSNGFAGGVPTAPDDSSPLHKQMLSLMRLIGIDRFDPGKRIYDVAERFEIEVWDDDMCGSQESMRDPTVDDDYAAAAQGDQSWEKEFNAIIKRLIEQA